MKRIITTGKVPIKSWTKDIEEGAIIQAEAVANLPFVFKHVALMPDVHQGYGMPIGGVACLKNVVVPHMVGADIGCGMVAVKSTLEKIDTTTLKKVMDVVRKKIPVGFLKHKEPQQSSLLPVPVGKISEEQYENAELQLGTLGGGNHFLEFQKGDDGFIYIMIHSGSRNPGYQIADHYNKKAIEWNKAWLIDGQKDLAYLPLGIEIGQEYLEEMQWALDYAYANRMVMIYRTMDALSDVVKKYKKKNVGFGEIINVHHNYARMENHFGTNVLVHRKGATSAKLDEIGLIPGSQGTFSYIVKGKGNEDSFKSCSHGAGRKMGRKFAQKNLDLVYEMKKLNDQGILHSIRGKEDLDEASGAYKDISKVMKEQADLIDIVVELKPLGVVKG